MNGISIVIPMFDEARHIVRTLKAARAAADAAELACELIVVDNGSRDEGPALAEAGGARVLHQPGLYIGALRNRGAATARYDSLAFLDADIEVPLDWLRQWTSRAERGDADVLALACDTPRQAPWYARAWQRRSLPAAAEQRPSWLPSANLCLPRDAFEAAGGFNEQLRTGEDKDFGLRLHGLGARQLLLKSPSVLHWGYEACWSEWFGKELWRQGSHLQLLRTRAYAHWRLLRFPMLALSNWLPTLLALSSIVGGLLPLALVFGAVSTAPALLLSLRQSVRQGDPTLTLQLWILHWLRLHLAGGAFLFSLFNWTARRPARG
ncbi:glycosyl transferase family 2 [Stutzerimonas stutzeri]|uniref:Glycosyl transferase family 2 n=1 Tax=Stutzerimonas stutzeri TaxID=316 RepID=W8RFS2_STUST|nr:glycosyltransferase [Stutzerimonas stutzeri]AHL77382.1 glycosyl transferase family 2 [Stutzerimonas stutzeri]MCQ4330277.1 glycosyltransferase [Stutzerimonas stutzeri]